MAAACVAVGLGAGVPLARAQGDDRAVAEALVAQLAPSAADAVRGPVTAEALTRAKEALERGTRLRRSGDEAHAKTADGRAREWAETARDLGRAAEAESTAADLRRRAMTEQAQVERARALLEEGVARVGRLRAQIEEARRAGGGRRAVEAHEGEPTADAADGKKPKGARAAIAADAGAP